VNRHERRHFQRLLESEIEQERNGRPIRPELAAHMTKPLSDTFALYQVAVDWTNEDGTREIVAASPSFGERAYADHFCSLIEQQLAAGRLTMMRNPRVVPLLQGVH
jgi:hypothetical protein